MQGTTRGKKYFASKHFYRFIRPGARRVKLIFTSSDGVMGSAFEHTGLGNFVVVLINSSEKPVKANLTGAAIPNEFDYYLSTSVDECKKRDTKVNKNDVILPAKSIVTLVNGSFAE